MFILISLMVHALKVFLRFLVLAAGLVLAGAVLVLGVLSAAGLVLRYRWRKKNGTQSSSPWAPFSNGSNQVDHNVVDVQAREVKSPQTQSPHLPRR
jgi:hypothetical protein